MRFVISYTHGVIIPHFCLTHQSTQKQYQYFIDSSNQKQFIHPKYTETAKIDIKVMSRIHVVLRYTKKITCVAMELKGNVQCTHTWRNTCVS